MSTVEDRLAELERRFNSLFKAFDMLCEETIKDARRIVALEVHSESLRVDSQRWNEVYYHIFPDRLRQDIKLQDQLFDIRHRPNPKDGGTKA